MFMLNILCDVIHDVIDKHVYVWRFDWSGNWGEFKMKVELFPSLEFFSYLIDILNHFLRLLRRTSRDRKVYWPPLK